MSCACPLADKGPKDSADPDTNTTDTYALALTSNGLHEVAAAEIAAIEQLCGADPTNPVDYEMGVNANARRKARDNTREDVSYTSDAEADGGFPARTHLASRAVGTSWPFQ